MKQYKLIASGYSSFDHIIKLNQPVTVGETSLIENATCRKIYWGGCSVNITIALKRLGIPTSVILRTGDDYQSSGFERFLLQENMPQETITHVPGEINPTSFLLQAPNGEHITTFYPGAMNEKYFSPYKDEWFEHAETALMTVASLKDNKEFLNKVKKHQLPLFFGMKGDFSAFPIDFLKEVLQSSEIIFMNVIEKKQIIELLHLHSITDLFSFSKAKVIVTTLGSNGSKYYSSTGEKERVSPVKMGIINDTTGGGDAFISGFLYGYFKGKSYLECCKLGSSLSAFVLTKEGCCTNLPDKKRFNEFLLQQQILSSTS